LPRIITESLKPGPASNGPSDDLRVGKKHDETFKKNGTSVKRGSWGGQLFGKRASEHRCGAFGVPWVEGEGAETKGEPEKRRKKSTVEACVGQCKTQFSMRGGDCCGIKVSYCSHLANEKKRKDVKGGSTSESRRRRYEKETSATSRPRGCAVRRVQTNACVKN